MYQSVSVPAGSGKTTALSAVRNGFESAGYRVIGAATSGQAARNLSHGAGIGAHTVASLTRRLDHGGITLNDRDVVVLDEGAMTSDLDIARLLGAVSRCGAKLVIVGDDCQLGAIGPGGGLTALCQRHPEQTWQLTDNLRQTEAGEAAALAHLRAGHLPSALTWYASHARIRPVADRRAAVLTMARAWAGDVAAGRNSLLLAYRRDSVEALNQVARTLVERAGGLTGPEIIAPGGRRYRAGDRVVTLAPGPDRAWVTSQTALVTAVNPDSNVIDARTPEGRHLHFGPEEIGADRLAHGYAMTAHRAQGATVDAAHVLDDGGGRELAYVAMSRGRHTSHVYVVAGDLRAPPPASSGPGTTSVATSGRSTRPGLLSASQTCKQSERNSSSKSPPMSASNSPTLAPSSTCGRPRTRAVMASQGRRIGLHSWNQQLPPDGSSSSTTPKSSSESKRSIGKSCNGARQPAERPRPSLHSAGRLPLSRGRTVRRWAVRLVRSSDCQPEVRRRDPAGILRRSKAKTAR